MKLQKNFIKKISCLLIISLLSLNLTFLTVPKKANALFGAGDIVFDPGVFARLTLDYGIKVTEKFISQAIKAAALKIIKMMTQATVDWINQGFEGNPAYISNLGDFLGGEGGVADQTIGDFFANEPGLAFLCEPFQLQVKLAYYKQLYEEAYILANIEIKKQDIWAKQRRIQQDLNRHNMYELPGKSNRLSWRRNI